MNWRDLVGKSILYVCATVAMMASISSCRLSNETIQNCRTACTTTFSHMKEVTPKKCVCGEDLESEWVIPR